MSTISVVHATRGRPAQALARRVDYLAKARGPVEYLLVCDEDDAESREAFAAAHVPHAVSPTKGGPAAFNAGAATVTGDVIVVAADDVVPPDRWDELVLERIGDASLARVLAVSDGHRHDHLQAHPILTRARLKRQGWRIFPQDYIDAGTGMYADSDFTENAYADGVVIEARDLVFEHAHPAFGKAAWDETYARANNPDAYAKGLAIFRRRHPAVAPKATVGLCMIVKDEAHVLARCLASVRPFISHWTIVDTGSTDGTQELARRELAGIAGEVHDRPWVDFGTNRTQALELARGHTDYLLVIDADDVLEPAPGFVMPVLHETSYALRVHHAELTHDRPHILRSDMGWRYVGVRHEYVTCDGKDVRGTMPGLAYRVVGGGARSQVSQAQKFRQDAEALKAHLKQHPTDTRAVFYLAQSYRDAGDLAAAVRTYGKRASMSGGFAEEVWCSLYQVARLLEATQAQHEFVVAAYLRAHEARPWRAEALCGLAAYCRSRREFALALLFSAAASVLRRPSDTLFLDQSVYDWRACDEYAVALFWNGRHHEAIDENRELLASGMLPASERPRVEANMEHSRKALTARS